MFFRAKTVSNPGAGACIGIIPFEAAIARDIEENIIISLT